VIPFDRQAQAAHSPLGSTDGARGAAEKLSDAQIAHIAYTAGDLDD
jgi:hypothetical protein